MEYFIFEEQLINKGLLRISLRNTIYGLGNSRSTYLIDFCGFGHSLKLNKLNKFFYIFFKYLIEDGMVRPLKHIYKWVRKGILYNDYIYKRDWLSIRSKEQKVYFLELQLYLEVGYEYQEENKFILVKDLDKYLKQDQGKYQKILHRRSFRYKQKLPVRGQRTISNARTVKRMKYY